MALVYTQLGDRHSAEDAAQEVFAVACRNLRSLRDRDKFGPWPVCRKCFRMADR